MLGSAAVHQAGVAHWACAQVIHMTGSVCSSHILVITAKGLIKHLGAGLSPKQGACKALLMSVSKR